MTVKQALKAKNKLVADIKACYEIVANHNSIEQGNPRRYSVKAKLDEAADLTKQLVELKTKIHRANLPMYNKIFELSELKSQVKNLKTLNCVSGRIAPSRFENSEPVVKHAEINVVERDNMIKSMELKIEQLQDELDKWNHNTLIED